MLSKAAPPRHLADALRSIADGAEPPAAPAGVGRATREERGWPGQQLGLSEREAEVVALAALGHRNREIAGALDVSVDTVKTHLARSFRKLDVHNRTALSALVHTSAEFRRTPAPA
ncbi:MAG: response regulator transcription factor [Acidimicrobiales bacterium]